MPETPPWTIEPIRRDHVRDSFDCGHPYLNVFLQRYARQSEDLRLARTCVAVKPKDLIVRGYYTMRTGQVAIRDLPPEETRRLPQYPVPVVHLARLAVDKTAQGHRLGETLLLDALEKALAGSRTVAAYAVEVIAIDAAARAFYERYGFRGLLDDRRHLYLPMKTVEALFGR